MSVAVEQSKGSTTGFSDHRLSPAPLDTQPTPSPAPNFVRDLAQRLITWLRATGRHGAWIALWSVIGWGGTALAPVLGDRPFLVMLLAPRALFVALATDSVSLVPFVLLGTLRLGMTDASYFILGRRFPQQHRRPRRRLATSMLGRLRGVVIAWTDALCRWLCSHGFKAGTVLFFRPNGKYLAVAGAYGVSARVAAGSSIVGTVIYLASFHLGMGLLL